MLAVRWAGSIGSNPMTPASAPSHTIANVKPVSSAAVRRVCRMNSRVPSSSWPPAHGSQRLSSARFASISA